MAAPNHSTNFGATLTVRMDNFWHHVRQVEILDELLTDTQVAFDHFDSKWVVRSAFSL